VSQDPESELRRLIEPILGAEGLELVELALKGGSAHRLLRLDIDRAGAGGVDLADCQRISRALEDVLDESDLIPGHYVLEVSSPGIDRPIRTPDDIRRNTGRWVVVTTSEAGHERAYRGKLLGSSEGSMRLETEDREEIRIPLETVVTARREVRF